MRESAEELDIRTQAREATFRMRTRSNRVGGRAEDHEPLPFPAASWREPELALSERRPILGGLVTSDRTTEPDFDMHYGVELGVVLSGRMRRYYTTWETELGPGQVWFCGMWERHGWRVATAPCNSLGLGLVPQLLLGARFLEAPEVDWMAPFRVPPEQRPRAEGRLREEVLATVERFRGGLAEDNPSLSVTLRLLAFQLLLVLLKEWRVPSGRYVPVKATYYEAINRSVELALRRPGLRTAEAARECGMNCSAFAREFERLMGISFAKFSLRHRLSEAAARLTSTEASVVEIAKECGFAQASHFHDRFKEHYRVSPAAYRRRQSG